MKIGFKRLRMVENRVMEEELGKKKSFIEFESDRRILKEGIRM